MEGTLGYNLNKLLFGFVCMYVHVCVPVWKCAYNVCACTWGSQKSTLDVLPNGLSALFSETGSHPEPGAHLFTSLASHQFPGILKCVPPRARLTGAHNSTLLFTLVLGIWTRLLMFPWQVFY